MPSCGRTVLGRAAQLGHVAIVCLLLDADKFYSTPEEEDGILQCLMSEQNTYSNDSSSKDVLPSASGISTAHFEKEFMTRFRMRNVFKNSKRPQSYKCCSPSIDSETCTCSDEVGSYSHITENLPFLISHKVNFLYQKYILIFFFFFFFSSVRAFSQKFGVTQHTA